MSKASVETFDNVVKPTLTPRQREVLEAIERLENLYNKPMTMFDVADSMGLGNMAYTISGRFGELVKKGFIEVRDKTKARYNLKKADAEQSTFTLYSLTTYKLF